MTDSRMATPNSSARFLISSPSSEAINFLRASSISVGEATSFLFPHSLARTPTSRISVINIVFLGWSECIGQAAIGTPMLKLSIQEFQPQWVKNPPVDECPKISSCGVQSLTIIPTPLTRSS